MITDRKKQMNMLVFWAIAWALTFIASAILFKGNPIKDWIQGILFIVGMTLWLWKSQRLARPRC